MKNNKNPYNKAIERMEREVARALSSVKNLEKLYAEMKKRT